ncbi:MAG: PLP-dependent aminotransferase family protein [Oscillospiraceae bacterium]|nr:PLP-dependent aminotransferase family protein [Oscillospiraceae bacterium]
MRTYVLDAGNKKPLYEQLYHAVKEDILAGRIPGGEKLPSKRALAEHLNISRVTVETAYEQLLAEGYVISRPRSGYYAQSLPTLPKAIPEQPSAVFDAAPSLPSASAGHFPFSVWARLMRGVLLDHRDQLLQPPPNLGLAELRQAIARQLRRSRGFDPDPGCIVIGAGAEYLYNILIQLLGREHRYGLEDPGHRKIARVYEANGVSVAAVSLDEQGIDMQALRSSGAAVMHLSPGHQYPTGIVTPIGRRGELMAWLAEQPDRWLIEDDYDSEFRFSGRPIPTMFSMDPVGRVIYMNTFSKTITPALRISYMILPKALMAQYHEKLGFYSCTVPSFEQLTLAKFLDDGYFDKHVSRMRRHYRVLRDEFLSQLRASSCADRITVQGHEAGLHMLLRLQTPLSDEETQTRLAQAGVRAAALRQYEMCPAAEGQQGIMVVSYSDLELGQLPRLIQVLEQITTQAS